jgi:hypothetical protein
MGASRRKSISNSIGGDMIGATTMKKLKFVVEKHRDGYVAYPLG